MPKVDIATRNKELGIRALLESICRDNGMTLRNVFHSADIIYRNPDSTDYIYDPSKPGQNDGWYKKYVADGKNTDDIMELKYPRD